MKFSDWKSRVQALFRPTQHDRVPTSHQSVPLAASNAPKPVEIHVPSTGERFIHDSSLTPIADRLEVTIDEHAELETSSSFAHLHEAAAQQIQSWDGQSVREISTGLLYDYPEHESLPALQETVPLNVRKALWNPAPEDPKYRHSITVLAIDRSGEALIKHYSVDDSLDAEGWSYSTVPLERAIQLLQQHGLIENVNLEFNRSLLDGTVQAEAALPGATYRGPILATDSDVAYQADGAGVVVGHQVEQLAIDDIQPLIGKEVEISYPCGQVGLVRQVDGMAYGNSERQNFAEKTSDGLER